MPSPSRTDWDALFGILAAMFKESNDSGEYVVDSLPIPVCDNNIRIWRSKLYEGERFRGYIASKKRYFFYGLRVHMLVSAAEGGKPVEFFLEAGQPTTTPPSEGLRVGFACWIDRFYADKQYNDYQNTRIY